MNDESDVWGEELEAYVEAYADEERSGIDAAAALKRFNDAQLEAPILLVERRGRRRALAFALVGAALAAGLAGVWVSNGRSFQLDASRSAASLTQDAADTAGETQTVVPAEPEPSRNVRTLETRSVQAAPPEPEPEPEANPEPEPVESPESKRSFARRTPRPSSSPEPEVVPSPQPSALSRELAMLGALRTSARARDYAKALKLVRAHRTEFPKPTLAAERDLIELESLCGLGRTSQVDAAKKSFTKAHPTHHLRAKAEKVCEKKSGRVQNVDSPRHQGE